jgi:hypothetical protein
MRKTSSFRRSARFFWSSVLAVGSLSAASAPALAGRPDIFDLQNYLKQMNDAPRPQMQAISPAKPAPAQRLPDLPGARRK